MCQFLCLFFCEVAPICLVVYLQQDELSVSQRHVTVMHKADEMFLLKQAGCFVCTLRRSNTNSFTSQVNRICCGNSEVTLQQLRQPLIKQ